MEFTGERMMPEFNEGQEIYLEHMIRYFFASQFVKDKEVLDIACGSGYGTDHLLKKGAKKIIGVDISEETISYCKNRYKEEKISFKVGSVEKIPLEDNSVDVVISFETIEHVNENAQNCFMKEIKRVLRPDGVFVVSTPNSIVFPKGNPFHIKELNYEEFSFVLKSNFKNVEIFFQDNIECGFISSKASIEGVDNKNVISEKIGENKAEDSLYFVAVCKNTELENIIEYNGFSNIKPHIQYSKLMSLIQEKDLIIEQKDWFIKQKEDEINFMTSSKFWKIKRFYEKFKNPVFYVLKKVKFFLLLFIRKFEYIIDDLYKRVSKKRKVNIDSIKSVYFVSNVTQGGARKYIVDLIETFETSQVNFVKISNKGDLNFYKNFFKENDIFIFQYLFESDLSLPGRAAGREGASQGS